MLRFLTSPWQNLWKHRELLWQFTLRNIELRHKGSHLGLIWSFLNPLLMLGLYVFVFGYIFGGKFGVHPNETRAEYALGVFLALTLFQFIAETLSTSPVVIIANPNFVKKVVFPLEILPVANIAAALFHLFISMALVIIGIIIFDLNISFGAFWLPIIIIPLILLGLGIGWMFSALGVFFRDLMQITQFLALALMYSSAIFYPISRIPSSIWMFLRFNPLLLIIDQARDITLWQRTINPTHITYVYIAGISIFYIGYSSFRRMKSTFADVL